MSGKMIQRIIGLIVVCALLAGCLAGCVIILNPNISERPNVNESGEPVSDKGAAETPPAASPIAPPPAAKTLYRETVTTSYGDGRVTVVVTEYLESGLIARMYSADDSDNENQEIRYEYDEQGAPIRIHMYLSGDDDAIIEITNHYENGKIVSAQISDILIFGKSALDADTMPDYLSSMLLLLPHYEGYRDAEISIRNTEICIRLQNGEVVYSCSDEGVLRTTTEITQDSNGHKTTLVTTVISDSENDIPVTISETDEYGRIIEFGSVMGQQSMMMQIVYGVQPNSDARQRTEVGHVAEIQNDLDTDYSDDQLEALVSQYSFTYTFADDVLVFSEVIMDTQKTTYEYSADGLLLRQTVEINTGDYIYSTVTEYEYQ